MKRAKKSERADLVCRPLSMRALEKLMRKGAKDAEELGRVLKPMFTPTAEDLSLILD